MTQPIKVKRLKDVDSLTTHWQNYNRSEAGPGSSALLTTALRCLSTGAVFATIHDGSTIGFCCVEVDKHIGTVRGLPKDPGLGISGVCLSVLKSWAQGVDVNELQIVTENFNGSAFRYFEKTLGFQRKHITFSTKV